MADKFNVVARGQRQEAFLQEAPTTLYVRSSALRCWAASARKGGEEIASKSPGQLGVSRAEMPKSKVLVLQTERLGTYRLVRCSG